MSITQPNAVRFPAEALTPGVETDLFKINPEATFWLGITATHDVVETPSEYHAAGVLRANVYIDEMGFLSDEDRLPDGTESDKDDERSTHFTVIENQLSIGAIARTVGNGRLIHKRSEEDKLPVESLFPEAFTDGAAEVNAVEVSRFIARHPNKFTQNVISLSVIRAMAIHCHNNGTVPAYAVIERPLGLLFDKIGLPYEQLSELKMVEEYHTKNMAIRINPSDVLRVAAEDTENKKLISTVINDTVLEVNGQGYFDESLISPIPHAPMPPKVA